MRRQTRPMQITDAPPSHAEELHRREVRYVVMMCIRAVCIIVATVLVTAHAPLLVVWVPVLIAGAVIIPWLAVVIANDRPPKRQYRLSGHLAHRPPDQRALTPSEEDPNPDPRIIDAEP